MAYRHASVIREVHRLYRLGASGGMSDSQLIQQFLARQDDDAETAFEVLVERHGPMVLRICRSVLGDEHDAEDAFQTTFLVLARKARFLWVKDSLASWLRAVSFRVASKARINALRRRRHERQAAARAAMETAAVPNFSQSDDEALVAEEIARLPERYRAAHRPLLLAGDVVPGGSEPPRPERRCRERPVGPGHASGADPG